MPNPIKLIDIFNAQMAKASSAGEHLACDACEGSGEEIALHPETGHDYVPCRVCLGNGYNQLGLIMLNLLKPPPDGNGPVALKGNLGSQLPQTEDLPGENHPTERRSRKNKIKKQQSESQTCPPSACQPPQVRQSNQPIQ